MSSTVINSSYFERGFTYIPKVKDITPQIEGSSANGNGDLHDFIVEYERELLLNSLGVDLTDTLYSVLNHLDDPGNEKFKRLVNGYTYTNKAGVKKRWEGLKGFNHLHSVIAYYVFCKYLRNDVDTYTTVGVTRPNAKNAEMVDPTPKFMNVYNLFIKSYQGYHPMPYATDYIGNRFSVGQNAFGSIGVDWYTDDIQVSLYQFLRDYNELFDDNFDTFQFKFYPYINSFGI